MLLVVHFVVQSISDNGTIDRIPEEIWKKLWWKVIECPCDIYTAPRDNSNPKRAVVLLCDVSRATRATSAFICEQMEMIGKNPIQVQMSLTDWTPNTEMMTLKMDVDNIRLYKGYPKDDYLRGVEDIVKGAKELERKVNAKTETDVDVDVDVDVDTPNRILVMNFMTPKKDSEKEFNEWYAKEHIPMLTKVPGWISSTRYIFEPLPEINMTEPSLFFKDSDNHTKPKPKPKLKYMALHEWAVGNGENKDKVFESVEYKAATNTVWREKVMEKVLEKERWVLEFVA